MTGHVDLGAVTSFVPRTLNVRPMPLVKLNESLAESPEPVTCTEPGEMVMGVIRLLGSTLALNARLALAIVVICKPQVYTTALTSRHGLGSSLTFADGHAKWFKYTYMCANAGSKAADPGDPDIIWSADGHVVP